MGTVLGVVVAVVLLGLLAVWQGTQIAVTFSRRYRYQQDRPPNLADFSRPGQGPSRSGPTGTSTTE